MVLGAVEAWIVPNTRCPVSAAWIAVSNVSRSRISPTSMMSGSSRTACFMPIDEVLHVHADLALIDQALVVGEGELDRVFERENVLAIAVVDPVEHRGDGGALARAGNARQEDHPLVELAQLGQRSAEGRGARSRGSRCSPAAPPARCAPSAARRSRGTASACRRCPACGRSRPRRPRRRSVSAAPARRSSGRSAAPSPRRRSAPRFSGRSVPLTRTIRRTADFQVQIAPFELHQRAEKLVDLQLWMLARKALLIAAGRHQWVRG